MKIKHLSLLLLFVAFNVQLKAQTVTDPWATLGASTIQTAFVVLDSNNNLYVSNFLNSTISKITPNGTVTQAWATLAGNTRPYGMVIDPSGVLYTVNRGSPSPYTISKITPTSDGSSGTVIQTWANLGTEAYTISMDTSGNLYVPFVSTNEIAKIVPAVGGATGIVTKPWVTLASGANPFSISFDAAGNLYSANSNNTISKITPAGVITQAWATLAAGSNPQFSVFDPAGNLYVSCWGTSTVTKINSIGTVLNVWSLGTSVWPAGIVLDNNGNIFTVNHNNNTVSKITSSGTVTQAFASLANGSNPFYLAKDTSGNLYTTNMGNGTVSKISYFPSVSITSSATGSICSGTSVTFTANAQNFTTSPTYQWTKNGIAIPGATSSTYSSTSLSNNDVIKVWVNAGIDNSAIVSNGLLLNLDASNPGSYSGTGNTWYDLSGNNNHGTLMNSPTYDAASGSIVTNGTNQYISIPQVSTANTNITMQAWVYVNLNTTGTFIKNGTGGGGYSIGIGNWAYDQVGSNVVMLLYGRGWIGSGVSYGTVGWKLVTLTLDGSSTARAYVNGNLIGTYTWPSPTYPSGPLSLGANIGDGNIYYNGKFAAAYFYNRALSQAEILQNYNAFATKSTGYGSNTITISLNGSIPTISVNGDGCINKTTLSTTSGLSSYTWYKDNVAISGATSNSYVPTATGAYSVQVSNGTCTNTSASTSMTACGLTAEGKLIPIENSTTLVSKDGATNSGKGIDERGLILTKPIYYGTVTTRTGRIWLDRNLGASRVALSSTDTQAYGDYYQWGRRTDGHEKQIALGLAGNFTSTKSATSVPPDDKYIFPSDGSFDWLITSDNTLWTGLNAPNNPCPAGFRIPTESEWAAEAAVFTSNNVAGSFEAGYGLKLTVGGMATSQSYITAIGNYGQYLTQTAYDNGRVKYFGVISYVTWFDTNYYKTTGQSCRCIKD
jgi:hypothetical protein